LDKENDAMKEQRPVTMAAVLLTGHGGFDKLTYRTDVPVPRPQNGEVLIRVRAAGINNTDINTRIGWYSKAVSGETDRGGAQGFDTVDDDDASWSGSKRSLRHTQGSIRHAGGQTFPTGCRPASS
jgi:hypothetical protein